MRHLINCVQCFDLSRTGLSNNARKHVERNFKRSNFKLKLTSPNRLKNVYSLFLFLYLNTPI